MSKPGTSEVHVCIVSDLVAVNLAPALDSEFRPKKIAFLVAPNMGEQADRMAAVLRRNGLSVSCWAVEDDWDIEQARDRVMELLIAYENRSVALNLSGGAPPLSIAAFEVFRSDDRPVFCVHPERDRLMWLYPILQDEYDLGDRVKLRDFLSAHGVEITAVGNISISSKIRKFTASLIKDIDRMASPLGSLNWLASQAEKSLRSPSLSEQQHKSRELNHLIERFETQKLLEYRQSVNRVIFPDENARRFVNGGWLEDYVYALVQELSGEVSIQDHARSIEVSRKTDRGDSVLNEVDVGFLSNNRLHVVECKTTRFGYADDGEGPGAEALYKLDTIKDVLGGMHAKAMLVSYRGLSKYDQQRAADLKIATCVGRELLELRSRLKKWILSST